MRVRTTAEPGKTIAGPAIETLVGCPGHWRRVSLPWGRRRKAKKSAGGNDGRGEYSGFGWRSAGHFRSGVEEGRRIHRGRRGRAQSSVRFCRKSHHHDRGG